MSTRFFNNLGILCVKKFPVCLSAVLFFIIFQSCLDSSENTKTFEIQLKNHWNSTNFQNFPAGGSYGKLFIVNHNSDYTLWRLGAIATSGFRIYVEHNNSTNLETELKAAKDKNHINFYSNHDFTTDTATISFQADKDFPLVSFVMKITPSPDWFLGENALQIYGGGSWTDKISRSLKLYDAGTRKTNDSTGENFNSTVDPQVPQDNIKEITSDTIIKPRSGREGFFSSYQIK